MQSLAIAHRQFKSPFVGNQIENIARGIQDGGAVTAVGKVFFDGIPQFRRDAIINVVRNLFPDVLAVQNHDAPALALNNLDKPPPRFVFSCGARIFCITSRARNRRAFTTPWLTPSMVAVSAILYSCTSRRISTSRYVSGKLSSA